MEYISLSKLFYSEPQNYKSIYNDRFNNSHTVHLDFDIKGKEAFFLLEPTIYNKIIDIYKIDKSILNLRRALPGKAVEQYTQRCLIDEIILTNDIEGVYSSRKEINSVLIELKNKSRKRRFNGLIKKYLMLQEEAETPLKTCKDIRELYNELVYSEIAEDDPDNLPDGEIFRKDSASVVTATQKEIHTGVNPESKIKSYMEKSLNILYNDSLPLIVRVAIFHYLFGYIHPFYDGNGRTSRYISSYLLSKEFDPLIAYRLSYSIKENIKKYYDAFKICNDPHNIGDLTPFIYMFVDIVYESMNSLLEALKKRYQYLSKYRYLITDLPYGTNEKYFPLYFLLLQASLFSDSGISTPELIDVLKISRGTVNNQIKELASYDLIEKKCEGNTHYYKLNLTRVDEMCKTLEL